MKKGKWIKEKAKFMKGLGLVFYCCSRCKNTVVLEEDSPLEDISEHKYCYNCGAKMGVEE